MKTYTESILGKTFDIKDPDTNFKGAKELIDIMTEDGWFYFGANGAFTYKYNNERGVPSKVSYYTLKEAIQNIMKQNRHKDNSCFMFQYRRSMDGFVIFRLIDENHAKCCNICEQGNTGNVIVSIRDLDSKWQIDRFRSSFNWSNVVPVGVIEVIEWCLKNVKK